MCTHPITISKTDPVTHQTRSYTVPCGKCAECVSRKRSEIAALSALQAQASGSLYFLTLTYSDEACPVMISEFESDGSLVHLGFERGCAEWHPDGRDFRNDVKLECSLARCCSLQREDVKLLFKRFRTNWKRLYGDKPVFKYLVFGEYGEQRGRPHYHALVYGLSFEQVSYLCRLWNDSFGFALHIPQERRELSYEECAKVSNYVSKYISKGTYSCWSYILPYVEQPRRQSSINFGVDDTALMGKLARFMMDATLSPGLDIRPLMNYVGSLIDVYLSRLTVTNMPSLNQ